MTDLHSDKNFCTRCELFKTITPEQIEKYAAEYKLPESECTSPEDTAERLHKCADCNYLQNGVLCSQCGMFVAFRAKIKNERCPSPEGSRW